MPLEDLLLWGGARAFCVTRYLGGQLLLLLEIHQRKRRLLPRIETEGGAARVGCRFEQRLIDRHIPRAGGRRVEEKAEESHRTPQTMTNVENQMSKEA